MTATLIAIGFALGFGCYHLLATLPVMWRVCCRAHFASHATCDCRDCAGAREAEDGVRR